MTAALLVMAAAMLVAGAGVVLIVFAFDRLLEEHRG